MSYARLGATCCTNMNVLLSNAKFIPVNDPVYKMFYTESSQYPGRGNVGLDREEMHKEAEPPTPPTPPRKQCCQR